MKKRIVRQCAVCGVRSNLSVREHWIRFSDNEIFNVCGLCRERGKVNEKSVENHKGKYTRASVTDPDVVERELSSFPDETRGKPTICRKVIRATRF